MKKDKYFIMKLKSRPVFPYIGMAKAGSKTAAIRMFIKYLTEKGYFSTKSSTSAYTVEEVTKKHAVNGSVGILKLGFTEDKPDELSKKSQKKRKLV